MSGFEDDWHHAAPALLALFLLMQGSVGAIFENPAALLLAIAVIAGMKAG